jgi:hypothetical protein
LFQSALEASVDRALAVSINSSCSASLRDEAAVTYDITLSAGDQAKTDAALGQVLAGDWSALESLENAVCRRNVVGRTSERTHKVGINLLGFYNALSSEKYLLSCRAVVDEHGDLTLIDKAQASRVLVGSKPYEADPEKLRKVLAESFLITITYAASRARRAGTRWAQISA